MNKKTDNTTLNDDELLRYSRQILLDGWDIEAQTQLKSCHAVIVGAGGLGCPMAQTLVRAGLGKLTLIDFDCIEMSNLQRQFLFEDADIGKNKAVVAAEKLRRQNPLAHIEARAKKVESHNCTELLSGADLVIDCTDNFAVRDLLNQTTRALKLPLLSTSAIGEVGQIALFTQETGCYRCLFGDDASDEQNCATSGVLASTVAIVGSLGAQVALSFLGENHNPIAHRLLLWQGKNLSLRSLNFAKDDACAICQKYNIS